MTGRMQNRSKITNLLYSTKHTNPPSNPLVCFTNTEQERNFQVHKIALQKRHPPLLTPSSILESTRANNAKSQTLDPLTGETTQLESDPCTHDTFLTIINRDWAIRFSCSFLGANKIRFSE